MFNYVLLPCFMNITTRSSLTSRPPHLAQPGQEVELGQRWDARPFARRREILLQKLNEEPRAGLVRLEVCFRRQSVRKDRLNHKQRTQVACPPTRRHIRVVHRVCELPDQIRIEPPAMPTISRRKRQAIGGKAGEILLQNRTHHVLAAMMAVPRAITHMLVATPAYSSVVIPRAATMLYSD